MTRRPLYLLLALVALLATAPPAGAKLNQSDWGDICVNPAKSTWAVGRPYLPNQVGTANCRVISSVGRDSRDRRFVVTVPKSALERRRIPVLFFFHGTKGTGEVYWDVSRWKEIAHREGFIAVFPSSLAYDLDTDDHPGRIEVWNVIGQACDLEDPDTVANDIAFVRAIARDLRSQLRIDRRRIYASGFSNGGQMSHRLAAEAGDIFAAAASWGGVPAEGDGEKQCAADPYGKSENPIPVWAGVGSKDRAVSGDVSEVPLEPDKIDRRIPRLFADASLLYSVASTHTREIAMDDFVRQPRLGNFSPTWSPVMVFDPLPGNTAGNEYLFVVLDDLRHHYPNAWPGHRRETRNSLGVTMAALQYQWFRDNPKPAP